MAWRVGPPSFRRFLATLGMLVPIVLLYLFVPAGAPDVVVYAGMGASVLVGYYLLNVFGVRFLT